MQCNGAKFIKQHLLNMFKITMYCRWLNCATFKTSLNDYHLKKISNLLSEEYFLSTYPVQSDRLQQQSSINMTSSKGCSYKLDTQRNRGASSETRASVGKLCSKSWSSILLPHKPAPNIQAVATCTHRCF